MLDPTDGHVAAATTTAAAEHPAPAPHHTPVVLDPQAVALWIADLLNGNLGGEEVTAKLSEIEGRLGPEGWIPFSVQLAQAAYAAYTAQAPPTVPIAVIERAMKAVERADELDPVNGEVLKQCAILAGVIAEAGHVNEKTFLANNFKAYLDAAVAVSPADPVLLHMRGRFIYQLTMLTADERDQTRFLDEMSEPSLQLALADLTKAYEQEPTAIDNLLYMARCLEGIGERDKARDCLQQIDGLAPNDGADEWHAREAADMLAKMGPPPAAPPQPEQQQQQQ